MYLEKRIFHLANAVCTEHFDTSVALSFFGSVEVSNRYDVNCPVIKQSHIITRWIIVHYKMSYVKTVYEFSSFFSVSFNLPIKHDSWLSYHAIRDWDALMSGKIVTCAGYYKKQRDLRIFFGNCVTLFVLPWLYLLFLPERMKFILAMKIFEYRSNTATATWGVIICQSNIICQSSYVSHHMSVADTKQNVPTECFIYYYWPYTMKLAKCRQNVTKTFWNVLQRSDDDPAFVVIWK